MTALIERPACTGITADVRRLGQRHPDKPIQFALMDVGGIVRESSRGYYE
ncbi:hypothetical protein [Pseudaminobacter soli (ex Li et al. 2025)]|nr:hypothetical protein [Mesorhizobium soli]